MRRETVYSVLRGYKFLPQNWDKLKDAFSRYEGQYTSSMKATNGLSQVFSVWRDDHKPLLKDEINSLYWFFRGVIAAHKINEEV